MLRRILNLTILASWLFAWSTAALHNHSHDCEHLSDESATHHAVAACGHHHHDDEPADETDSGSWDAECRLCEIQAIPFTAPQAAEVASIESMPSTAPRLNASGPSVAPPRRWNGRAPPLSS